MSSLLNMSISEFNQVLSSKAPAPGGGSAAALSGMLGAALTMMVVNLTIGKKAWEALEDNIKKQIKDDFAAMQTLNEELAVLVDEDTKAFTLFMQAMKLPKETETEKSYRDGQMQKASLFAMDVPLKTAEKCLQVLRHQKDIALYGNKGAISDIGVGAELASAGIKSAALNVKINLPSIDDETVKADAVHKIDRIIREGEILLADTMAIVERRIS
ncbi:MAG TPA: cyclodeaminase/cyclohydrolase family protein [Syntrophomonas sp.]|nr:cyclodeaminase/cyclohydrolase family protein [Syntrophomonas sp.]